MHTEGEIEKSHHLEASKGTSRSLFHYTSAEGLLGIVRTNSIFATHYSFLNDATECSLILDVLTPRIEVELKDVIPKLVQRGLFKPSILKDLRSEFYRGEAEKMLQAIVVATKKLSPFFISSFCIHQPHEDAYQHGLLSQWRGYAKGGFAIEFDELEVDKLSKKEHAEYRYQGILTDEVAYKDHAGKIDKESFSHFGGTLLKYLFPAQQESLADILGSKMPEDFAKPFFETAPFLKNLSFQEENEYRIVALCNRPNAGADDKRKSKLIQFRGRPNGQLVPYIALYGELGAKLPIKSIIVGPHPNLDGQRLAVEILLEQYNLDIPVRTSEIPFRI